ncbi:Schizosaccharomyces specific protein Tam5 [Schizosaccharomyces osmophilus]|uniref:Schizosaccharomyces specific protein Tam5 n=1 Tax=Schizosaccharomyces osmophilus TaxID=2545709 RepID=A0AAE9WD78_9SCHI|nr:Schizosaccharomyces specific protein Tam5 [Schizosaccharomyces osmophilus]WBW73251.1 Schizosaccharomyces specific protein Tam5 [Schizosaccharomyces osmophilus]
MDTNDCVLSLIDELEHRHQILSRLQTQFQQAFLQLTKKKAQYPSYTAQLPAATISKHPRCSVRLDAMEASSSTKHFNISSALQVRLQSHSPTMKPFIQSVSFDIVGHDFLSCLQEVALLCQSNQTIQLLLESIQNESTK